MSRSKYLPLFLCTGVLLLGGCPHALGPNTGNSSQAISIIPTNAAKDLDNAVSHTFGVRWPTGGGRSLQAMPPETRSVTFFVSQEGGQAQAFTLIRESGEETASRSVLLLPGNYSVLVRAYATDTPNDDSPVVASGAKSFSVVAGVQAQQVVITLEIHESPVPASPFPSAKPTATPDPTSPEPSPSPSSTPTTAPKSLSWGEVSPGINFNDSYFVSFTEGWVVGNAGVKKTVDAGETWTPVNTGYTGNFTAVCFAPGTNGMTGWVGGGNVLLKTTDGGASWANTTISLPSGTGPILKGIHFRDANRGYVALSSVNSYTERSGLFSTTDGGLTWTRIRDGDVTWLHGMPDGTLYFGTGIRNKYNGWGPTYRMKSGAVSTVNDYAFWFMGTHQDDSGRMLATFSNALYESQDGGLAWSKLSSPIGRWWGLGTVSDQEVLGIREDEEGYAYMPRIVESTDGGRNWTTLVTMSTSNNSFERDKVEGTNPRMFVFGHRKAWQAFTDNRVLLRIGEP
jgi:photosystem II stability/assembly factor-like uncharacterized protein